MQSFGIRKTGTIDVIEKLDLPVPVPKPHEVLVKVEYAGLNFLDTMQRAGLYPNMPSLPFALGAEASGTIVSLPADESVLAEEEFKKRGLMVGGRVAVYSLAAGCIAEYVATGWNYVAPLPEEVSLRDGVALLLQGVTAVTFIEESYKVQPRDYVLVHTVAGGLGLCLAQLISARGGIVIGTTSNAEKAAIAKAHGAAHVILYKSEDIVSRVLEITKGKGVQAIYDGVGKDTFEANFKMVAMKGSIVVMGAASGPPPQFNPMILLEKNVKFLVASAVHYFTEPADGRKYFREVFRLAVDGTLKMAVQKEYPFTLEGVKESQRALVEGRSVGKLLIKVAN